MDTGKTTQLSGLSDYELELEQIIDLILAEPSTLMRIGILRKYIDEGFPGQKEPDPREKWVVDVLNPYKWVWKPKGRNHYQCPQTHNLMTIPQVEEGIKMGYLQPYLQTQKQVESDHVSDQPNHSETT